MAKILVFNNDTNRMETYYRGEAEPMPYNTNGTLRVREFRGSSKSNILWTTKGVCKVGIVNDIYMEGLFLSDLLLRGHMREDMETKVNIMQVLHLMLVKH